MVKRPSPPKKVVKPRKDKIDEVLDKIEKGVPRVKFGRMNKDGTANINPEKLEEFKKKLEKKFGEAAFSKVHFVALNAPFKRRSPIPPA